MAPAGEGEDPLAELRGRVLWIGGAPDAGKTTLAQALARWHGLLLYVQDRMESDHFARATVERHPEMRAFWEMSSDERWVSRTPEEMAARVIRSSPERFALLVEDLLALSRDARLLAEGPWLFPELVAPALADPRQGLWLIPTPEFKRASAEHRDKPRARYETSDPERAAHNWLERDRLLAEHVRGSAVALGLSVWDVGRHQPPEELVACAERHFAPWLALR